MLDQPIAYVEYAPLDTYLVVFKLKGKTTEEVVKANSSTQAKEIIKARYEGQKIVIISSKKI
jgi:hypothetical protein